MATEAGVPAATETTDLEIVERMAILGQTTLSQKKEKEHTEKLLFARSQKKNKSSTKLQLLNGIFNFSHPPSTIEALYPPQQPRIQHHLKNLVLTYEELAQSVIQDFPTADYDTIWGKLTRWWSNYKCHNEHLRNFFQVILKTDQTE